jgi:hypothetical protein
LPDQLASWDDYDEDGKCVPSECYLNTPDNTLQVDQCGTGYTEVNSICVLYVDCTERRADENANEWPF